MQALQTITCNALNGQCDNPARWLLGGQALCDMDVIGKIRPDDARPLSRIAPEPETAPTAGGGAAPRHADQAGGYMEGLSGLVSSDSARGRCHTCGLPLARGGHCPECR